MNALDCIGIEFPIEELRQTLFEILSNNLIDVSHSSYDQSIAPDKLKIEILAESHVQISQVGISIERILDARVSSSIYRYYILKLKDFYCLPAFLATNPTNKPGYLELEIENQKPHYYVFSDKADFKRVFKGTVYDFSFPESPESVVLNVTTKEMNIFLNPSSLPKELYLLSTGGPGHGVTFKEQRYTIAPVSTILSQLEETNQINYELFVSLRLPYFIIVDNHSFTFTCSLNIPMKILPFQKMKL